MSRVDSKSYLVVGGGGREHAIVLKLLADNDCAKVTVAPGNPGILSSDPTRVELIDIQAGDIKQLRSWCVKKKPDLVIIGPEDPLNQGLVDLLENEGIKAFGPTKKAAEIECNKQFAKNFMSRNNIKTAKFETFSTSNKAYQYIDNEPGFEHGYVIKASGLASGKGVEITKTKEEAKAIVKRFIDDKHFGKSSETIVIEEFLVGEECSVLALSDGKEVMILPTAQDHKRAFDDDKGPMTGGMGAICPFDLVENDKYLKDKIENEVIKRCIDGLAKEGRKFVGTLFAGLMITSDKEVYVLEFNCRFGDPETQSVLPLVNVDNFGRLLSACVGENLSEESSKVAEQNKTANTTKLCGIVIADLDYPVSVTKNQIVSNLPRPTTPNQYAKPEDYNKQLPFVIHAGTKLGTNNEIVTNGGRILTVVGSGSSVEDARDAALKMVKEIKIDRSRFRTDIGYQCIQREQRDKTSITYKQSGVDIHKGDEFVSFIKSIVKTTDRPGTLPSIGAFAALFDLKKTQFKDPILVSGTDGVGTKLKLALEMNNMSTVGQDLVAMCVNDVLVHGALPLFFLDYYGCGSINMPIAKSVVSGIVEGCCLAGCSLIGGETAEMSGIYANDDIDLAGFVVGAVERCNMLPKSSSIKVGDIIIGLASTGIHSNGFSLVRKFLNNHNIGLSTICPFKTSNVNQTIGDYLLNPTKIYVDILRPILENQSQTLIKAMAHITGGGLIDNISRSIPDGLCANLDANKWPILPVFGWIMRDGPVSPAEMLKVFNLGIGMVLVVDVKDVDKLSELLSRNNDNKFYTIGTIVSQSNQTERNIKCNIDNLQSALTKSVSLVNSLQINNDCKQTKTNKRRVAILLSGTGTNARAIIEAQFKDSNKCSYEISLVISSNKSAPGLEFPKEKNIETLTIHRRDFKDRMEFESELHKALINSNIEYICLAGFMLILSSEFVKKWHGRLINIHPSLLPSFKGMHAYQQALIAGVRLTGCTVHFVNDGVDDGAIIAQRCIEVKPDDDEDSLQERGKLVEHSLYAEALELVTSGKVRYDAVENKALFS